MAGLGVAMAVSSSIRWVNGAFQKGDSDIAATQVVDVYGDMDDSRIGQLTDDILDNIVSRLATIEASRTSILARRWRKIWTMNLRIEFWCRHRQVKHIDCNDKLRFLKAVDQSLKLYSGQKLKTFWMSCCFLRDCSSHLEQWIQSLDRLGVEHIFLGSVLCSSSSSLEMITTFSFKLNSLLELHLKSVPLLKGELSCLLLSCPNLKVLDMKFCEMPLSLNISGPNLKSLELFSCKRLYELNICASNLVELNICNSSVDLLISSLPKLEFMYFNTSGNHIRPYPFVGVPSYLPQLKCLLIQSFTHEMPWITSSFNMFSNLRKLFMGMNLARMFDLGNIIPVLNLCPLLETFYVAFYVLVESRRTHTKEKRGEWPALRHKHLEHMELSGFSKTQHEFEFARFILRSSQVLECLVLKSSVRFPSSCSLCPSFADRGGGEEYASPEVQSICHDLQAHAVSIHAKVKMYR